MCLIFTWWYTIKLCLLTILVHSKECIIHICFWIIVHMCCWRIHKSKCAVIRVQQDCTCNLWLYLWWSRGKTQNFLFILVSNINKTTNFFLIFINKIPLLVSAEKRQSCLCRPSRVSLLFPKHSCLLSAFCLVSPVIPRDVKFSKFSMTSRLSCFPSAYATILANNLHALLHFHTLWKIP